MRASDLFKYAFKALGERKLRAVLTILGIVIGPATIVALVGATQGYSNATAARFETLGANTIFVTPVGRSFSLTSTVVQEIQNLPGVSYAVPYQEATGAVSEGGSTVNVQIYALDLGDLSTILPTLGLQQGSLPAGSDPVGAAVGYSIAYPGIQGAENSSVDQVITVSNIRTSSFVTFVGGGGLSSQGSNGASGGTERSFVVRGIFDSFGQSFLINPDGSIFISASAGQELLHSSTYTGVVVVASSSSAVTQVTSELSSEFGQNVRSTSVTSLLSTIQSVSQGTSTLLEAVAGTSVIVAFVGIMTTMLTSVLERTTEIGVLKALGASSRSIMLAFIAEASVTGLIGGAVGAGLGAALSFVVISYLSGSLNLGGLGLGGRAIARGAAVSPAASSTLTITPAITPELVAIAVVIALAVGTIGGILPAWRASRLTPVEALHRS